ncbi:MAG: alpha/beta hydrolase [Pirellulales bacterium]
MASCLRWAVGAVIFWCVSCPLASAQRTPAAEATRVQSRDGVELSVSFYPSRVAQDPALGKQVTPVVLLHDEKDTQGSFSSLVARLQQAGQGQNQPTFAIVTVDLRGHGASTRQTAPNGQIRELDAAKLSRNDIQAMTIYDMEAVRSMLVEKNDAGQLNLNKLCLVGVGLGATVAVNWAAQDWSAPPLLVGKQGQDVKALVLVSPQWKYRGIMMQQALKLAAMKKGAAWMLIFGEESSNQTADAHRMMKQLERFHPEPAANSTVPRGLVELPVKSSLEGSGLLSQMGQPIEERIVEFLKTNVASQELPWSKRRNRLQ